MNTVIHVSDPQTRKYNLIVMTDPFEKTLLQHHLRLRVSALQQPFLQIEIISLFMFFGAVDSSDTCFVDHRITYKLPQNIFLSNQKLDSSIQFPSFHFNILKT